MFEVVKAVTVKVDVVCVVVPYIPVDVRGHFAESCCTVTVVGSSSVASVWEPGALSS
jgi:hypothetical protein